MTETKQPLTKAAEIIEIKTESRETQPIKQEKKTPTSAQNIKSATKPAPEKTNEQENIDWFALARKLRHDNRQIIKNLVEKEEELAVIKEKLEAQIIKTQSADNLVQQQTEELHLANEQITRMLQELETAQRIINEKQKLIEEYSSQVTEGQEQIATLERQCSYLQDHHDQEKQKALVLEQKLKEAELRLQREQRHNLQFKAALDQCLETPGYVTPIGIVSEEQQNPAVISPTSRIPKNEGIKPWSTYLEEIEDIPETEQNNHQEKETKSENLIHRIKVLNNNNFDKDETDKKSPSPLLTRAKTTSKLKTKREIILPQFPRLKLDDQA